MMTSERTGNSPKRSYSSHAPEGKADSSGAPEGKADSSGAPEGKARRLFEEANSLDFAIYKAVADTPTPTLDVPMTWVARASNYSRISISIAVVLALKGGRRGRRAAIRGLIAVVAASFTADLAAKQLFPRTRPDRRTDVVGRQARMPKSSSFPSGHTASAFAFANAVTADFPQLALPLYGVAALVGYSRVHMGVHYPSDVAGGAVLGLAVGSEVREATGA